MHGGEIFDLVSIPCVKVAPSCCPSSTTQQNGSHTIDIPLVGFAAVAVFLLRLGTAAYERSWTLVPVGELCVSCWHAKQSPPPSVHFTKKASNAKRGKVSQTTIG